MTAETVDRALLERMLATGTLTPSQYIDALRRLGWWDSVPVVVS